MYAEEQNECNRNEYNHFYKQLSFINNEYNHFYKQNDKSPSDLAEVIVNSMELVQKKNPSARVAYSSIFKRRDDQTLNVKARKVNELLSEELSIRGIDFINNKNIIYSNLWKDGLHLNDGGVRKFSGNLSKFIKYC